MAGSQGFLGSLFDFSFSRFNIPTLAKAVFVLAILGSAAYGLGAWIGIAHGNGILGLLAGGAVGLLIFMAGVLIARLYLEVLVVISRIAEHTSTLVDRLEPGGGTGGGTGGGPGGGSDIPGPGSAPEGPRYDA